MHQQESQIQQFCIFICLCIHAYIYNNNSFRKPANLRVGERERSLRKGSWEWLKGRERGRTVSVKTLFKKERQKKFQVSSRSLKCQIFGCPNTGTERCSYIPQPKEQKEGFAYLIDSRAEYFVLTMC